MLGTVHPHLTVQWRADIQYIGNNIFSLSTTSKALVFKMKRLSKCVFAVVLKKCKQKQSQINRPQGFIVLLGYIFLFFVDYWKCREIIAMIA